MDDEQTDRRYEFAEDRIAELLERVIDIRLDFGARNAAGLEIIRLYVAMMKRADRLEAVLERWSVNDPRLRAAVDQILHDHPLPVSGAE